MTRMRNEQPVWMIRAGAGARLIERFLADGHVAIGWDRAGAIDIGESRRAITTRIQETWPNYKKNRVAIVAGQLYRFINVMEIDDRVLTYDPGRRIYILGTILSAAKFDASYEELCRIRKVNWDLDVRRDDISVPTKNTLGAISTLFRLSPAAAQRAGPGL